MSWLQFITEPGLEFDEVIDRVEAFAMHAAKHCPQPECPLKHDFPDGLYTREIFMPAGSVIISRIHRFDNPFFVLSGKLTVISEDEGTCHIEAPFRGFTKPGARRILLIHEDTVWVTVHPNPDNIKDAVELEEHLTFVKQNPFLLEEPCRS